MTTGLIIGYLIFLVVYMTAEEIRSRKNDK